MVFRIISFVAIVAVIIWLSQAFKARKVGFGSVWQWWRGQFKSAVAGGKKKGWGNFGVLQKLSYLGGLDLILILFLTGFLQPWILGHHMSGVLLLIHMVAAPLFAISLAVMALLWAFPHRYEGEKTGELKFRLKACFWGILALGVVVIGSISASMFSFADTGLQNLFLTIHRYAAVAFLIVVLLHSYLLSITNLQSKK